MVWCKRVSFLSIRSKGFVVGNPIHPLCTSTFLVYVVLSDKYI